MTVFLIQRLMQSIVVLFIITMLIFLSVNVIGNPVDILIDPECDQACRELAIRNLGLDRPLPEQYGLFLWRALHGDLGESFLMKIPATQLILERLPASLELALCAMFLALFAGIPMGMWAGMKPDTTSAKVIMGGSILGFSVPGFWIGLILIIIFAVELGWLPSSGRGATIELLGMRFSLFTANGLWHLALPAFTLSLYHMALIVRLVRAGVRETVHLDFIKFAQAKGLTPLRVLLVHLLKNILIPVVTILGLEFGGLMAYAVVTESVFAWPGMGKLLLESINILDRPVIVAYVILITFMFITINLMVDMLYSVLDPRVRLGGSSR